MYLIYFLFDRNTLKPRIIKKLIKINIEMMGYTATSEMEARLFLIMLKKGLFAAKAAPPVGGNP
jgi:hypothetical protein